MVGDGRLFQRAIKSRITIQCPHKVGRAIACEARLKENDVFIIISPSSILIIMDIADIAL